MPTYVIQPDAAAGLDTYLDRDNAFENYGTNTAWRVRSTFDVRDRVREVAKFDLTGIPVGETVASATLGLYLSAGVTAETFAIHRILAANSAWTEAGATFWHQVGTTNWAGSGGAHTYPYNDDGCSVSGTDYAATPLWSGDDGTTVGWHSFSLDVAEFNLMWAANYGIVHFQAGPTQDTVYRYYYSSDYTTDISLRPKLTVETTIPGPTIPVLLSSQRRWRM